ncbi:MAG: L-threonylcarbamoyladenylate synthase [Micromonosporaceae bacterium]|nr:L-threonylcarbamoyladenylate synthase [Micromonosporaceae bacterium]
MSEPGVMGEPGAMGEMARRAGACLAGGGVVLVPTDTVYGLAAHPTRDDAVDRVFALKRRPRTRNLPILIASLADLDALGVEITEPARLLMAAYFPGPLSLALGLRPGAAPAWLAGRTEVAVRMPADPAVLAILDVTGPLLVTSANLHEQSTPESVPSILAMLDGEPDFVVDGGVRQGQPSTLVNCNLAVPAVEREGAIPRDAIERVLR